ncbi:Disease resistance protein [Trichinella spiralis]|uniref:Disease resistance protein n=1 Tax=Trichinella spiralis TaxID=6334 RepID=A0ABR3KBP8_TRISP
MKQNSSSDEIREQICVRLYKIRKVIFLRVSCYSRAFNIRLLLSFLTCSGAYPVELHGGYWHILQDGKPPASLLFAIASTPEKPSSS